MRLAQLRYRFDPFAAASSHEEGVVVDFDRLAPPPRLPHHHVEGAGRSGVVDVAQDVHGRMGQRGCERGRVLLLAPRPHAHVVHAGYVPFAGEQHPILDVQTAPKVHDVGFDPVIHAHALHFGRQHSLRLRQKKRPRARQRGSVLCQAHACQPALRGCGGVLPERAPRMARQDGVRVGVDHDALRHACTRFRRDSQYALANGTRPVDSPPQTTHLPLPDFSLSNGRQRMVTDRSFVIFSSHAGLPHQWLMAKPP